MRVHRLVALGPLDEAVKQLYSYGNIGDAEYDVLVAKGLRDRRGEVIDVLPPPPPPPEVEESEALVFEKESDMDSNYTDRRSTEESKIPPTVYTVNKSSVPSPPLFSLCAGIWGVITNKLGKRALSNLVRTCRTVHGYTISTLHERILRNIACHVSTDFSDRVLCIARDRELA